MRRIAVEEAINRGRRGEKEDERKDQLLTDDEPIVWTRQSNVLSTSGSTVYIYAFIGNASFQAEI